MEQEAELFSRYLKDYLDLWVHFCAHIKGTPKQITDEVLFKQEFTFEKWKQGYWDYKTNRSFTHSLGGIEFDRNVSVTYNIYRFIPFNIRYEVTS